MAPKKVNPFKKREKTITIEGVNLIITGMTRGEYLQISNNMKDNNSEDFTDSIIEKCVHLEDGSELDVNSLPVDIVVQLGEILSEEIFNKIPKTDDEKKN